jgi:succinate dehydrogenase / fumarate reductase flavoprotein subunit
MEIIQPPQGERKTAYIDDRGTVFNQDVLGRIELGYMLDCAECIVDRRARAQGVARGPVPHGLPRAQRRRVLKHINVSATAATCRTSLLPVTITQWQPEERKY